MVDSEKPKANVIQIGEIEVPIRDTGKKPMDIDASVDIPSQKPVMANDHEAGSSKSAVDKYHQYTKEEIVAPSQQRKEGAGEREEEG